MKAKKIILRIVIVVVAILVAAGIAFVCVFNKEISTVNTVKTLSGADDEGNKPVVTMEYKNDYYLDDLIAQGGVSSNEELINFAVNLQTPHFTTWFPMLQATAP